MLLGVPLQAEVLKAVSGLAEIRDIGTPGHIFGCVIAMAKSSDEQAGAVLQAAMAAHPWMKIVVVVDADVDPHDADEVLWAIHTRTTPDTGLHAIPGVEAFSAPMCARSTAASSDRRRRSPCTCAMSSGGGASRDRRIFGLEDYLPP